MFSRGHPLCQIVHFLHCEDNQILGSQLDLGTRVINMLHFVLVTGLLSFVSVQGFKIVSKVEPVEDPESFVSSASPHNYQRSIEIDSPYPDHATYEAVFAGAKKPLAVDCTQPGVICKFPLIVASKEDDSSKPARLKAVPVIKGIDTSGSDYKIEGREGSSEKEDMITLKTTGIKSDPQVPIYKGSLDIETVTADEKDIEDTWILEKNSHNKKYQIPVKLFPPKYNYGHGMAPVFPTHHDFHDHYNGGHPYNFPDRHGPGWTPWIRSYPSVHNYPSNQPCHPPVYHHPPPCTPAVTPTKKPVINIDDKVDKEVD